MGGGHPRRTARIRSRCSRSRRRAGSPSWSRSGTGGCWSRPFTFYRGAALIMAADLAATPQSGVTVQLCGDAHLSNFGLFGTPERQMLFDINDFDETLPGPWEWDVKRLAASFEVMGRDRGFSPADRRDIVMAGVKEYRDRMRQAAGMRSLERLVRAPRGRDAAQAGPQGGPRQAGQQEGGPGDRGDGGEGADPRQHPGVRQAGRRGRR